MYKFSNADRKVCLNALITTMGGLSELKKSIIKLFRFRQTNNIYEIYRECIANEILYLDALKEVREILRKITKEIQTDREEEKEKNKINDKVFK